MKRYIVALVSVLFIALFSMRVAFASETCEYATDGEACEIWYFYNEENHWRACVNHDDVYGNDAAVSEEEAHTFEEGKCTVCDMKESKGSFTMSYWIVFVAVGIAGLFATARARTTFKNAKLDQTPFGLDKYKRRY